MQKISVTALIPLVILIIYAVIACGLAYGILSLFGDILPLHKLISKTTLVLLILSIYPFTRLLKLSWQDIGFNGYKLFGQQLVLGLSLGLVTLAPVLSLLYLLDVQVLDLTQTWTFTEIITKSGIYLALGILISILEEPLFRGVLLSYFQRNLTIILAIILSSIYYAALHFLKPNISLDYADISFVGGLELMLNAFANWLNPEVFSAFIALMMVGIFLAVIRTQIVYSLGLCIGYHASWVAQIKFSKKFFNLNDNAEYFYLVSTYDGVVGWLVSFWMLVLIIVYLTYRHYRFKIASLT